VAVPLLLFAGMVGLVVLLAILHLAQPGVPKAVAGSAIELGDSYRGETVFGQTCAGCHGELGKGGGVGPRLNGSPITLTLVKARIEGGKGVMPAGLLSGGPEKDVLAYVATIIAAPAPVASAAAGQTLFAEKGCAACHGQGGAGGGVGPKLAGRGLAEDVVRARIAQGKGVMPAGIVAGADVNSVVAYLRSVGAVG
jgi:mono/diheme cytochrome c family protein